MKSHPLSDIKLLTEGVKGLNGIKGLTGAWCLGILYVEYERLKKQD